MRKHDWNLSPSEAVALQNQLRTEIKIQPFGQPIRYIGGTDLSFNKFEDDLYAGIVLLDYETMQVVGRSLVKTKMTFPYVPGLLSFREIPALIEAWEQLPIQPEVIMVDGHGIAHPRRMGIATHFGLVIEKPTMGCAKKILAGRFEEPAVEKGSTSPILHRQEQIGYALRTKAKVKPVFISPGHLLSLPESVEIALHCTRNHKLPEPTRQAHLAVNAFRRGEVAAGFEEL